MLERIKKYGDLQHILDHPVVTKSQVDGDEPKFREVVIGS
jgi:hypothetical protein